jgi:hypothetical protein
VYIRRKEVVEIVNNSHNRLGRNQAIRQKFRLNSGKRSCEQTYGVVPTALPMIFLRRKS